jgi:hypothetical protein
MKNRSLDFPVASSPEDEAGKRSSKKLTQI